MDQEGREASQGREEADGEELKRTALSRRNPKGGGGWDDYAPFYDWENARTMGRRDVGYWTRFVANTRGRVLELGCGTGRLAMPLSKVTRQFIGIDFSSQMLARGLARARRRPSRTRPRLLRSDMRQLPFADASVECVVAGYGVLQSLMSDADLDATLKDVARVLTPGGRFGLDLVPDLTRWQTYQKQTRFRGTLKGRSLTLVESVRQDRQRGLTMFDEEFLVGRGRSAVSHEFTLTFRTLPMERLLARLEAAGLKVTNVSGSYRGGEWNEDSDVWLVTATRKG